MLGQYQRLCCVNIWYHTCVCTVEIQETCFTARNVLGK
jgi:hypothetical protein